MPAEDIGQRAAAELLEALASGACCDQWLQDQLVIFMALAQVGASPGGWRGLAGVGGAGHAVAGGVLVPPHACMPPLLPAALACSGPQQSA